MGAFFQDLTPDIKVTVVENSERNPMTPTYIHKLNLGFNMSYTCNMRHAFNTMFCLLSVSCLVGELFLLTHDRYAYSMLYKYSRTSMARIGLGL